MTLEDALAEMPIVAIIRGVQPAEVVAIAEAACAEGIRAIEVPLNSPEPFESIRRLAAVGERMAYGAGTVLSPAAVDQAAEAGAQFIVSPNTDPAVIARTVERGLVSLPGFGTVSEAFTAYAAGGRRLKLFPASTYGPGHVKALLDVLPKDAMVMAVGGAKPALMPEWWAAGVRGFGLGGDLYKAGSTPQEVGAAAAAAVAAVRKLMG